MGRHIAKRSKVRWGRVREIKHVGRVGDANYNALPLRLKHLSAWRAMHRLAKHASVRGYGTRNKVRPSSNLRLTGKVSKTAFIQRRTSQ